MIDVQRVSLSQKDREAIRQAREKAELTQSEAGLKAWPKLSGVSAKIRWSQMENQDDKILSVDKLNAALSVVGLELTGTLKVRKVKS